MRKTLLGLAAIAVALPAVPSTAAAQPHQRYDRGQHHQRYDRHHGRDRAQYARYYDRRGYYTGPTWRGRNGRYHCRRSDGTTGLLIGGVAGALLGRSIDTRGDRSAGTLLGVIGGALLGQAIDKDGGRRCR